MKLIVKSAANSGKHSLRAALMQANHTTEPVTITFDDSITSLKLYRPLRILSGTDVTIEGDVEITCADLTSHFNIFDEYKSNTKVTLRNLILKEGKGYRAGSIHFESYPANESHLILDNVTFKHNEATTGGGSLYLNQVNLTATNCSFLFNTSIKNNTERNSGAITTIGSKDVILTSCLFSDNKGINGGAINSLQANLVINDCIFRRNSLKKAEIDPTDNLRPTLRGFGGAIYIDRASRLTDEFGQFIIEDSVFSKNTGRTQGGAIYAFTGAQDTAIIKNSLFEANQTIGLDTVNNGQGGAIALMSTHPISDVTLTSNTLINNQAYSGGGLWVLNPFSFIDQNEFSNNQAVIGGAIWSKQQGIISNNLIQDNSATITGGIHSLFPLDLSTNTFISNIPNDSNQ